MLPAHQTVVRHFAFNFDTMTKSNFIETIQHGHSIVFFHGSDALHTAVGVAMKHNIPTVTFVSKESLRRWQRVHTTDPNGILLVHVNNCTGWHTYADRIVWINDPYYDQLEMYEEAAKRIRGKQVTPIIFKMDEIK